MDDKSYNVQFFQVNIEFFHKVILAETLSPTFVGLTFQVIIIADVILTLIFN